MKRAFTPRKNLIRNLVAPGAALAVAGWCSAFAAGTAIPANLGGGLRSLLQQYQTHPESITDRLHGTAHLALDEQDRIRVNVHANGRATLDTLKAQLETLGAVVTTLYPGYRQGIVTAYIPIEHMAEAARLPGVMSIITSHNPVMNVGATTSQGTQIMQSDVVNTAGITGTGITVGVMSDSYNKNGKASTTARDDVNSGDLPDLSNTNPKSPGVKFLIDGPRSGTDEGRGMAQIVHDVAPGADLCFATAYNAETDFANNIVSLRTDPSCLADVIVDDVIYFAEPMFSDGVIAQAVDSVATSTVLAGKPVSYFSSAGNSGKGYSSVLRIVSDSVARATNDATVDLSTIPSSVDTSGGFHNFSSVAGQVDISQEVTCVAAACQVVMQWDDPFDIAGGVTTDLNFLVFDTNGQYVSSLSLTDDNFSSEEPIEISSTSLTAGTSYRIVIARTGSGSQAAQYVRYVFFDGALSGQYLSDAGSYASTYGHNSATHANGVAAYSYDSVQITTPPYDTYTPAVEYFTSPGPVTIMFDASGNRLTTPVIRQRPNIAAPDGVDTTFFPPGSGNDSDGDGFPNFYGTSAAAPHAAGVAALLLQKAGGSGMLSGSAVTTALQSTTAARDIDPLYAAATSGALTVSGNGGISTDPNFFNISLASSTSGPSLTGLTIDLTAAGLQFDPTTASGFPITVGSTTGPTITSTLPTAVTQVLQLTFSGFAPGNSLMFGVDRDIAAIASYGNSADLLAGATIQATFSDGSTASQTFANTTGTSYSNWDGYGLINAQAAVASVTPTSSTPPSSSSGGSSGGGAFGLELLGGFSLLGLLRRTTRRKR